MDHEPHSARYLNDTRDLWWNEDFLALIAARTGLAHAARVLDCGAGLGHWTRTVARLAPHAELTGLEREPAWVARASADAPPRVSFLAGDVYALPFADGAFDVVTCQTLLIHLRDPRAAVREMVRVLRADGRLLLCEPNNLAEGVARLCVLPSFDLEDALAWLRLEATCEKGKHALGLGYNSLGEGLVELLDPSLVDDVSVWNNDKCTVFAPGESAAQRAARAEIADELRMLADDGFTWSREETLRYFRAGGGRDEDFAPLLARTRRAWAQRIEALARGTLSQNGGGMFYVASARKR
ncbi:MAG: class I SAM-dependent methyltransferase [Deltaproteobacteria bacterium]|nr:class I SAM-dependent methyltransferase [Deltaproteobacteria bacterium]